MSIKYPNGNLPFMQVDNIAERNSILPRLRSEGMRYVYVKDEQKTYYLKGGILNIHWTEIGSSSSPYVNYTAVTYAELEVLVDASALSPGAWYLITDYRTSFDPSSGTGYVGGIVLHGDVEQLLVQALTINTFINKALSLTSNDTIFYDFNDKYVVNDAEAEMQDGVNTPGYNSLFTYINSNTVEINRILTEDNFGISVNDGTNFYNYSSVDLGVGVTFTHGAGTTTITILDPIDLSSPSWGIYFYGYYSMYNRTGYITRRENEEYNIITAFDYKEYRRTRFRIDSTTVPDYDSATFYNKKDKVKQGSTIYMWIGLDNSVNGKDPSSSSNQIYWVIFLRSYANDYYFISDHFSGTPIVLDFANPVYHYALGYGDSTNGTFKLNNEYCINIEVYSQDCVISGLNEFSGYRNILVNDSSAISLMGSPKYINLDSGSYNFIIAKTTSINSFSMRLSAYSHVLIDGSLYYSEIDYFYESVLNNFSYSKIGCNCGSLYIRNGSYVELKGLSGSIYLGTVSNSSFGEDNSTMTILTGSYIETGKSCAKIYSTNTAINNFSKVKFGEYFYGYGFSSPISKVEFKGYSRDSTVNTYIAIAYPINNSVIGRQFSETASNITGGIFSCVIGDRFNNINITGVLNKCIIGDDVVSIVGDNDFLNCKFNGINDNITVTSPTYNIEYMNFEIGAGNFTITDQSRNSSLYNKYIEKGRTDGSCVMTYYNDLDERVFLDDSEF